MCLMPKLGTNQFLQFQCMLITGLVKRKQNVLHPVFMIRTSAFNVQPHNQKVGIFLLAY